jgi:methyl-accepting chemotaxis protein
MWTFGRKIAAGFALSFILLVVIGTVSYRSTTSLTKTSYWVDHTHVVLEHIANLMSLLKDAETGQRGFIIAGKENFLEPYQRAVVEIPKTLKELRTLTADNPNQQTRLDQVESVVAARLAMAKRLLEVRATDGLDSAAKMIATGEDKKLMDDLRVVLAEMDHEERVLLKQRADEVEAAGTSTKTTIVGGTVLSAIVVLIAAFALTRSLTSQIGSAVRHIQSSSTELQAAANQQVTSAREQATAMSEITTTISELLATSRQIAESARRVAQIASETATAARHGDQTLQKTQESVTSIKRQVDVIVAHMLELGKKSQQIGGILEIINELAEQTNILAINATIEAAGAGDSGKRFAVVADEIRKLSDRVSGSTKEIRVLVDDIRAAVNTTVMATEGGSKAVDAGARQFSEVTVSFRQIAGLVGTTTDASREIELSTKQQTTAVEQVNVAVANVAQAGQETEASSAQTLQTSSQLASLSRELARVIQHDRAA